ncbi:MAG: nucleoside monophosphate kinase [Candidatus Moraniibacteriota bacterium]|nr:MAG: nucleoside monophosphate kinase [Candidatus Moranbacteria bacterium]
MNHPRTVILLGPPGSGKSTQASAMVREMDAVHIDIGLALRKTAELPTPLGRKVSEIMNHRMGLVPDDIVEEVLSGALVAIPGEALVVLDGVPRRLEQISLVDSILSVFGRTIGAVISMTLPEEEVLKRIGLRRFCKVCGRPIPPEGPLITACPSCGGELLKEKTIPKKECGNDSRSFARILLPFLNTIEPKDYCMK